MCENTKKNKTAIYTSNLLECIRKQFYFFVEDKDLRSSYKSYIP